MLDGLSKRFSDIFKSFGSKGKITQNNIEEAIQEVKIALLDSDVNTKTVRRFIKKVENEAIGQKVLESLKPQEVFFNIVHNKIVEILGQTHTPIELKATDVQSTILFLGLQGSGKTTTVAKLALYLKEKKKRRPLLVACDLVRPAAIDQLEILAKANDIAIYLDREEKKPKNIVEKALVFAKKNQYDTVLIDTAGRLQIDQDLMSELKDIKKASKAIESLLVVDSMMGQSALEVTKEFDKEIGIDGVILSKFDSDTKGGVALSIKETIEKPIKFMGIGEKVGDFDVFDPIRVANRILDMGDILGLIEKVQSVTSEDASETQRKVMTASFNLEDYLIKFQEIRKMGNLKSIVSMIPGIKGANVNLDDVDDNEIKRDEAIILSMTKKERINPNILGLSRKKRIAAGSGVNVSVVSKLLKNFQKMNNTMKKISKSKKLQRHLMSKLEKR